MLRRLAVLTAALLAGAAVPASAVTSVDGCIPECDSHQLEWRADPASPWLSVGAPVAVADIVRSDTGQSARGIEWTGLDESPGNEFRGQALRGNDVSPFSLPLVIPEPPVAPLLLASLGTIVILREGRRRRR